MWNYRGNRIKYLELIGGKEKWKDGQVNYPAGINFLLFAHNQTEAKS
jgi:hypothetical protein